MISLRLVSPKYAAWPEILEIQEALMLEFMPQVWQSRKIQYCSLSSKSVWCRSFFLLEGGHPSLLWFDEVHFANKGPSSQSYGFLSSHVQMWELNHKEIWELKNWWFWHMVLEKTLESPLDSKEIKPVHPKGNQSWIFIDGTDAEAKAPILRWPDAKNWLTGKDPDAGKGGRWEGKGRTEDEMVGLHHWLNGHEFEQVLGAGDAQEGLVCCSPWGCKETDMTEWLNWLTDPHYGAETSRLISEHHHQFKLTHKVKHHNHTPGMILNESILEKAMAVLLPGKSHVWRSLEGYSPWGRWGSDVTEQLPFHFSLLCIGEGNGHCSCLDNPRDRGAWWAAVYGVAQSRTRLKWLSIGRRESTGLCRNYCTWIEGGNGHFKDCGAVWLLQSALNALTTTQGILSKPELLYGRF